MEDCTAAGGGEPVSACRLAGTSSGDGTQVEIQGVVEIKHTLCTEEQLGSKEVQVIVKEAAMSKAVNSEALSTRMAGLCCWSVKTSATVGLILSSDWPGSQVSLAATAGGVHTISIWSNCNLLASCALGVRNVNNTDDSIVSQRVNNIPGLHSHSTLGERNWQDHLPAG